MSQPPWKYNRPFKRRDTLLMIPLIMFNVGAGGWEGGGGGVGGEGRGGGGGEGGGESAIPQTPQYHHTMMVIVVKGTAVTKTRIPVRMFEVVIFAIVYRNDYATKITLAVFTEYADLSVNKNSIISPLIPPP